MALCLIMSGAAIQTAGLADINAAAAFVPLEERQGAGGQAAGSGQRVGGVGVQTAGSGQVAGEILTTGGNSVSGGIPAAGEIPVVAGGQTRGGARSSGTAKSGGIANSSGIALTPAPRIPAAIMWVPGMGTLGWLLDNKGRTWVRDLPMNMYVVFKLPRPYTHLLFQWMSSINYNYTDTRLGGPESYQIDISSNSTNGRDGDWISAADVKNNYVAARAHVIESENIRWIRFRVTGGGLAIDEIDIHDLEQCEPGGAWDTWGFIGDSITAFAYWRDAEAGKPFNMRVNEQNPDRYPSMINFGVGGDKAEDVYARLPRTLELNDGIHFWAIGIGSNDVDAVRYEQYLRNILDLLIDNGKEPIIARIPYSSSLSDARIRSLNAVVDRLTVEYGLFAGPDLYNYYRGHLSCLAGDGLHPSYEGMEAMNELWAKTALAIGGGTHRIPEVNRR